MPLTRTLGALTVTALQDGEGPFYESRETVFTATAAQWAAADGFDPGARTPDGQWWLRFRCFAIRYGDGPVTLVDAGIGPAGSLAADWAPVPGLLPEELAAAGIDPAEVSSIVLTHLHTDHIGWAVPGYSPFVEARVVVQQADVDAYTASAGLTRQSEVLLEPLRAAGRLDVIDGDTTLGPGIRAVATPGHTPGHQSVLVEAADESLLVTGDLLVHAIQLLHPELHYGHDMDAERASATRREVLSTAAARGSLLATSHLGEPFRRAGE